ncbi:DUF4236 domain-containing protein [Loktanella sp. F6476L]|nr:DUF4236 domain-containing protein [Loktanella sp. F6476L]
MPGVKLNLSGGGTSLSVGGKGATLNVGKRGVTQTANIPGTGLSWSRTTGWNAGTSNSNAQVISGIMELAGKRLDRVEAIAKKGDAIVSRLNKAINSLSGGRGITPSKLDTFGKRVSFEEEKMIVLEAELEEAAEIFVAMKDKLGSMSFGLFGGSVKRQRNIGIVAIENAHSETVRVIMQFNKLADSIAEKVSEIEVNTD